MNKKFKFKSIFRAAVISMVTGLNVARQNVADKMLRTKCRGQMVAKKTSHGQMVARTKCCMDKMLHGQIVAKTKRRRT